MSKKHFIELARIMRENKNNMSQANFTKMCRDLASFCAKQSSTFRMSTFLEACGVE